MAGEGHQQRSISITGIEENISKWDQSKIVMVLWPYKEALKDVLERKVETYGKGRNAACGMTT